MSDLDDPFASADEYTATPQRISIKRGRYYAPDPDTGTWSTWTRVSTLASAVADQYAVLKWQNRLVARGMSVRPDLVLLAESLAGTETKEDKATLDGIVASALDTAGANSGSNTGTAYHTLTERMDGEEGLCPCQVSPRASVKLKGYRDLLAAAGIEVMPEYIERIVFNRQTECIGTLDRLVMVPGYELPVVADLKTQKDMRYGCLHIAAQLATYANATHMWSKVESRWEPMPQVDKSLALVIHVPTKESEQPTLQRVDIESGWDTIIPQAQSIREVRKLERKLITRYTS